MKHLRLTHLRIMIDCTVLQGVPHDFPHGDLANDECEPDLQPIAARFMDTMSTLDCLLLEARYRTYVVSCGPDWMEDEGQTVRKWRSSNAWQVVRDVRDEALFPSGANSPRSWTELSGEAAERIEDQEELDVFRAEEVGGLLRLRESSVLTWYHGARYDNGGTLQSIIEFNSSGHHDTSRRPLSQCPRIPRIRDLFWLVAAERQGRYSEPCPSKRTLNLPRTCTST